MVDVASTLLILNCHVGSARRVSGDFKVNCPPRITKVF